MENLRGLTTGIGSLPHKDAEAALDLIFQYCPQVPFWPQLPKRDGREGMVAQFSQNLPCLKYTPEGLIFNHQRQDAELEKFYERIIAQDKEYFQIRPDFALGLHKFYQRLEKQDLKGIEFIKCHITGPFTFAASINDDTDRALLHDQVMMQATLKGLLMKALWQIDYFSKFGKKIIIFIDEPYLGCFGSAYTPLNREDVVKALAEFSADIKSENTLIGVHCCGNTDWSIFTEIKTIDIINFDAFGFLDKFVLYADNLKDFTERGGMICWGIVPTQEFSGSESADLLAGKIKTGINILTKKGVDKDLLLDNLLLSPSCGLGALDPGKSESIFRLLQATSSVIKQFSL